MDIQPILVSGGTRTRFNSFTSQAKEKEQQAALKASANQQAQMLEDKRKDAQKQKGKRRKASEPWQ